MAGALLKPSKPVLLTSPSNFYLFCIEFAKTFMRAQHAEQGWLPNDDFSHFHCLLTLLLLSAFAY